MSELPLVPLFDKILVRRQKETQTASGIIIPITAQEGSLKATIGEILAVGSTAQGVVAGDKILFGTYSGSDFEYEDEKFIIMPDTDVLCRIKGSEELEAERQALIVTEEPQAEEKE